MLTTRQKISFARAIYYLVRLWRGATGRQMTGIFCRNGLSYELDLAEGIDFAIYLLRSFEADTVRCYRKILKQGDTVLDIGANIGSHTLQFAKLVAPHGQVFAFEPTKYAFNKLRRNVQLNIDLSSCITMYQCFLGESPAAEKPMEIYSGWPLVNQGTVLHKKHQGALHNTEGSFVTSLDKFVSDSGLKGIDLIKLDVDGNEISVLRGAVKVLSKMRPKIIMEMAPYGFAESGYEFEELIDILLCNGYHMYEINSKRELPLNAERIEQSIPDGSSINVLLI